MHNRTCYDWQWSQSSGSKPFPQALLEPVAFSSSLDHDVAEVNHAYQLDAYGNLARYQLSWPHSTTSVEDLTLLPQHIEVIHAFWQALGSFESSIPDPQPGESYADVMLRLMMQIFAGTGLDFLSWWTFQATSCSSLVQELLSSIKWQ